MTLPWGNRIYEARKAKRLSQAQLGALLGVDQTIVSRWEHGLLAVRDTVKPKLARALGVAPEDLFPWSEAEEEVA